MFLARTVFHCPVRMLQKRIDAQEFAEWQAEYNLEPWGDDWQQAAMQAAASMQPWTKSSIDRDSLIPRKSRLQQKPQRQRVYSDAEILAGYQQLQAIQKAKQNGDSRIS